MTFRIKPGNAPAGGATAKRAFAGIAAKAPKPNAYHVAMSSRKSDKQRSPKVTALIAKEAGGKIVSHRKLVSR